MFLSYSKNGEDIALNKALNNPGSGFYFTLAESSSRFGLIARSFYERGLRGINIESDLESFHELIMTMPEDINIYLPHYFSSIDTESSDHQKSLADYKGIVNIEFLFKKYEIKKIDFIAIERSSNTLKIIEGINLSCYRPKIIMITDPDIEPSVKNLSEGKIETFLKNHDYRLIYFDGVNRYFKDKNEQTILDKSYLPDRLDLYQTFKELNLRKNVELLKNDISMLSKRYSEAVQSAESKRFELEQLREESSILSEKLTNISNSFSWKLTYPLRLVRTVQIRFFKKFNITVFESLNLKFFLFENLSKKLCWSLFSTLRFFKNLLARYLPRLTLRLREIFVLKQLYHKLYNKIHISENRLEQPFFLPSDEDEIFKLFLSKAYKIKNVKKRIL